MHMNSQQSDGATNSNDWEEDDHRGGAEELEYSALENDREHGDEVDSAKLALNEAASAR
jgi:hypothetical protein